VKFVGTPAAASEKSRNPKHKITTNVSLREKRVQP
jgi:hypothetical protein